VDELANNLSQGLVLMRKETSGLVNVPLAEGGWVHDQCLQLVLGRHGIQSVYASRSTILQEVDFPVRYHQKRNVLSSFTVAVGLLKVQFKNMFLPGLDWRLGFKDAQVPKTVIKATSFQVQFLTYVRLLPSGKAQEAVYLDTGVVALRLHRAAPLLHVFRRV